jgi:UDP-sugar transporter A1/2/3
MPTPEPLTGFKGWLLKNRTLLLLIALVVQKCVTDVLTNLTRRQATYSVTSVALLSEVVKFPLLIVAVAMFGGGRKKIVPTLKATVTDRPFSLVGVSLCYSIQNVLYFLALSHLSAESYQVLSQSKLLFTATLMMGILGTRLRAGQWGALGMLLGGSLLVQLSEASRATVAGGNAYLGGLWAILGSLLSSLPNVYYEKLLKEPDTNEWARNIQMTGWIFLWILFSMFFEGKGLALDMTGFSANVWIIIALKAFNCLLIPATLKYADNILYSYAKPTSIVLTCALSSIVSGAAAPPPRARSFVRASSGAQRVARPKP